MKFVLEYVLPLLLLLHTSAALPGVISIYWGQDGREARLNETCQTGRYAYVIIGFLNVFGTTQTPQLNLAGHCIPAAKLTSQNCVFLADEIKYCQSKHIKVLLSIGGSVGTYNLTSNIYVTNVADYLWNNFLGGKSTSRPLGNAILDGIDLAISEGSSVHYPDLVTSLRKKNKSILISGAPFCPFPDKYLGPALASTRFDYVWVQFYKRPQCEYNKVSWNKLIEAWKLWTASEKVNVGKIFLGLMAADGIGITGYIPASVLTSKILPMIRNSTKYGGVMLWSKYWDEKGNYSAQIIDSVRCTKC